MAAAAARRLLRLFILYAFSFLQSWLPLLPTVFYDGAGGAHTSWTTGNYRYKVESKHELESNYRYKV